MHLYHVQLYNAYYDTALNADEGAPFSSHSSQSPNTGSLTSLRAAAMAANDRDLAIRIPQQTWDRRLIERESKELKVRVSVVSNRKF